MRIKVESRPRDGAPTVVEGTATEPECQAILAGVIEGRLWEAKSVDTTGFPDEPRPRAEVRVDGRSVAVVEGWRHELKRNDGFRAVRDGLQSLALRLSTAGSSR